LLFVPRPDRPLQKLSQKRLSPSNSANEKNWWGSKRQEGALGRIASGLGLAGTSVRGVEEALGIGGEGGYTEWPS